MKDKNIDNSLAAARSLSDHFERDGKRIRTHAERRVKLNDTFIKKLRPRNKLYSIGDSEMVGVRIYVQPSGSKKGYYAYCPKNEKNWVREPLGNFNVMNIEQMRNKARTFSAGLLEGKDPVQLKRELKAEPTLKELIERFYNKRFNRNYGYKPKTIEAVKTCFKVWVFQNTLDVAVRKVQKENPYSIQHKKIF